MRAQAYQRERERLIWNKWDFKRLQKRFSQYLAVYWTEYNAEWNKEVYKREKFFCGFPFVVWFYLNT